MNRYIFYIANVPGIFDITILLHSNTNLNLILNALSIIAMAFLFVGKSTTVWQLVQSSENEMTELVWQLVQSSEKEMTELESFFEEK